MKDNKYWQSRAEQIILDSEQSVLQYEAKLLRTYEIALIEIRRDIDAFFGKYANQNKIPYEQVRRRLAPGELRSFQQEVQEWYKAAQALNMPEEYKDYLKKLSARVYLSRLDSLYASIRFEMEKLAAGKHTSFTELATDNYVAAYYGNYYNLAVGAEIKVNFAKLDNIGIETALKTRWEGANYSDRIGYDKVKLITALEKLLPQSFSRGLSSNQIGDLIAKEIGASKNRTRVLARTEINYLCNQSALNVYKSANLERYQYLATLDMRTSEICRDLDGLIAKVSQAQVGINYPPMHPNCRSTSIPYFDDSDDDEDDRIARNTEGKNIKVSRKTTQEQWINQYVPEDQRERLLKFKGKSKSD